MKRIAGDWLRGENLTPISIYQDKNDTINDPDKRRLMDGRHRLAALTQFMAGYLPAIIIYEDMPTECIGQKSFHVVQWWYDKIDGKDNNLVNRKYFENGGIIKLDKVRSQRYICYECGQKIRNFDDEREPRLWTFAYEDHAICYQCWINKSEQQRQISQEREEGELSEIKGKDLKFSQTNKIGGFNKQSIQVYNKILTNEDRCIFDNSLSTVFFYHKLHDENQARKEFEQISVLSTPFTIEDKLRTLLQTTEYGKHINFILQPVTDFLRTHAHRTDKGTHGVDIVDDALQRSTGTELTLSAQLLMQCWYKVRSYRNPGFSADDFINSTKKNIINQLKFAFDIDTEELRSHTYSNIDKASKLLQYGIEELRSILAPDSRLAQSYIIHLVDIFSDKLALSCLDKADYIEDRKHFMACLMHTLHEGRPITILTEPMHVSSQDPYANKKRIVETILENCPHSATLIKRGTKRPRA